MRCRESCFIPAAGWSLRTGSKAENYLYQEKSITQSTVVMAFHKALDMEGKVKGPKKLGTFGASYLYPLLLKLGVIQTETKSCII